jgi:hypothetical protein
VNSEKDFKNINPLMMRRDEHDRAGTDPAIHGIMVTLDRTDERLLNPKKKEALFQMFEKLMNGTCASQRALTPPPGYHTSEASLRC